MRKIVAFFAVFALTLNAMAQKVTLYFNDVSMSEALKQIATQSQTEINFIYDELEDFRVTAHIDRQSVENAVKIAAGFYPVRVIRRNGIFAVECTHKSERHFSGSLIDDEGQPIAYANIALLNVQDSAFITGGISNDGGVFVIPCEQKSVIVKISFIGYKTVFRTTDSTNLGIIKMEPEVRTIEGVVIKGNRKTITSQVDRMQYNVAADPFAQGLDAKELMRRVPLLSVSTGGGVSIVGKSNTHILIDGKELPESLVNAKLAALRSEDIEKVEVITIPPSKYKAETNAGYVNIVLRKDKTLGINGMIGAELTFRDETSWNVSPSINYATKKFDISVAANINKFDGKNKRKSVVEFSDHDKTSESENHFDWLNYSTNIITKYQINNNISVGMLGGVSGNKQDASQHDITSELNILAESNSDSPDITNYSIPLEFFTDILIDSTGKAVTLTYDYLNNYDDDNVLLTTNFSDGRSNKIQTVGNNRYRIDSWKADFALPFHWATVETGAAFTNIHNASEIAISDDLSGSFILNPNQSNNYDYNEKTAALYFSAERKFGDKFSAKVGLRAEQTWIDGNLLETNDKHSDDYLHVFPSVHLGYDVSDEAHIGAAYSRGITRPNFMDLNPFRYYFTANKYVSGNPYLLPGLTDNFEVNFSHDIGIYAVLYESRQHDGIDYPTVFLSDGSEVTTGVNCYESDKAGLYVSWDGDIFDWCSVSIGGEVFYSGYRATKSDVGLMNVDSWSGKLETDLDFYLNADGTLALELSYSHEFPYMENIQKYRTWVLFGGGISYMLLDNRLKLRCRFSDPFHQNMSRTVTRYDGYDVRSTFDSCVRNVSISASYFFGGQSVRRTWRQSKNTDANRAGSRG